MQGFSILLSHSIPKNIITPSPNRKQQHNSSLTPQPNPHPTPTRSTSTVQTSPQGTFVTLWVHKLWSTRRHARNLGGNHRFTPTNSWTARKKPSKNGGKGAILFPIWEGWSLLRGYVILNFWGGVLNGNRGRHIAESCNSVLFESGCLSQSKYLENKPVKTRRFGMRNLPIPWLCS